MYDIRTLIYLALSLLFVIFIFYMIVNAVVTIRDRSIARDRNGRAQRSIEVTSSKTSEVRLIIGGDSRPGKCILHIEERRPERETETIQMSNSAVNGPSSKQETSMSPLTSDIVKNRGALIYPTGLHLTPRSVISSLLVEVSTDERAYIASGAITIDPTSREALFTLDSTSLPPGLPGPWHIRVGFIVKVETEPEQLSNDDTFDSFFNTP